MVCAAQSIAACSDSTTPVLHCPTTCLSVRPSGHAVACRNVFCAAELGDDGQLRRGADGLARGLRAVIADFGRTVALPEDGGKGKVDDPKQPLRDQPPEVLAQKVFTRRSDSCVLMLKMPLFQSALQH